MIFRIILVESCWFFFLVFWLIRVDSCCMSLLPCGAAKQIFTVMLGTMSTVTIKDSILFYFPRKADTISQPVKAWKNSRPLDFSKLWFTTISWIGNHLMDWPWPNSTQITSNPASRRVPKTLTAITRKKASVSHALLHLLLGGMKSMFEDSGVSFFIVART